jgi:2-hydroxymuconate-semialdehyde hydrolase
MTLRNDALEPQFFDFEGMRVAYYRVGKGQPILLIHGSGPGASSLGNWRSVIGPLSERFAVYAMDLVGFGRSPRKRNSPYFDFRLWVRQAQAMLDLIGSVSVPVIGHSLAGALSLTLAANDARVSRVVTTATMGAPFVPNDISWRTWTCPTNRAELVHALSGLIFDTSRITDGYLETREAVVYEPGYANYFNAMFGGDKMQYVNAATLSAEALAKIGCPVLMMHGKNDPGFPASISMQLAASICQADLYIISKCSHSVAYEHPDKFLALTIPFCTLSDT